MTGRCWANWRTFREETQGIREVVRRHSEGTLRVELGTEEVLWDLNTPEQYRAALEQSG